ncbi:hypothetical protein [Vibrio phage phiKT1024]|nr:hypothetical protein [Vibrio phage phiKT1024]
MQPTQPIKTSGHLKKHMKQRNLEWYKTMSPGEVFYDVSNRTIRKHTFVGYFQDHQSLWIVRDSGGLTRLHDRMYPHYEYDIMVERIKVVERMKIEAQIKTLKSKLKFFETQLESDIELETLDFTDGSSDQPFASELDHTVHLIREIHNDGNLVQTNIDFQRPPPSPVEPKWQEVHESYRPNPPKRPVGIKNVKDGL